MVFAIFFILVLLFDEDVRLAESQPTGTTGRLFDAGQTLLRLYLEHFDERAGIRNASDADARGS
jgi:hypothetical protein